MQALRNYLALISLLFLNSFTLANDKHFPSLIESVNITKHRVEIIVNKDFKQKYLLDNFFAEYDEDIDLTKLDHSIVIMPFIMNVISIIWTSGKTYYIDSMDEELYHSLELIRRIFSLMYPDTPWNGQLLSRKLVKNRFPNHVTSKPSDTYIALLYSGGLDSIVSSLRHMDKKQLLITAWGHSDMTLGQHHQWHKYKNQFITYAQNYGHSNAFIRSNYYAFLNRTFLDRWHPEITSWRMQIVEGLGWAGLTAPILVSKGYTKLFIGSSISWSCPFIHAANPMIDDNIHFAGISLHHDAFELSRVDKNEYLATLCREKRLKRPFIKVCPSNNINGNCCRCEKCFRTINGFLCIDEPFQEYGFPISTNEAIARLKKFLTLNKSWRMRVWHLVCMQQKVKQRLKQGHELSNYLKWFMNFDLEPILKHDKHHNKTINWKEFYDQVQEIKRAS